jgi:hypothetical protein
MFNVSTYFGHYFAHPQEALHGRRLGGYCVLKLLIISCRTIHIQYFLLDYIGLDVSESENAVGFCTLPVVDVGWSQDMGRLLRVDKGAAICRVDAAWRACHKSVGTLGYGLRIAALVLLRNYVTMMHGQQNINLIYSSYIRFVS